MNRLHVGFIVLLGLVAAWSLVDGSMSADQRPWAFAWVVGASLIALRAPFTGVVLSPEELRIRGYLRSRSVPSAAVRSFTSVEGTERRADLPSVRTLVVFVERPGSRASQVEISTVRQFPRSAFATVLRLNAYLAATRGAGRTSQT